MNLPQGKEILDRALHCILGAPVFAVMATFIFLVVFLTVKGLMSLSGDSVQLKGQPQTLIEFYDENQVYHRLTPSEFAKFREDHPDALYLTQSSAAGSGGGIGLPFRGTLSLVSTGLFIATLIGLPSAIFISEVKTRNFLASWIENSIHALAGVPSIVLGLVGFVVFGYAFPVITQSEPLDRSLLTLPLPWGSARDDDLLPLTISFQGWGPSLITGAAVLGCLVLPGLTRAFVRSLQKVETAYRENATVLGVSNRQILWKVVIPAARFSLLADLLSASTRIIGATAALLFIGSYATPAINPPQREQQPWLSQLAQRFQGECHALSFHCFEVSRYSPGSDLARPMMETTAFLLVLLVLVAAVLSELCRQTSKRRNPLHQ